MARDVLGAECINFEQVDANVVEELLMRTGGRGPDVCIDAVGPEALGHGVGSTVDWAKQLLRMQSDRPNVLRQCTKKKPTTALKSSSNPGTNIRL